MSFLTIFRVATAFPDKMVDKSSHEKLHPPFKISRSAYALSCEHYSDSDKPAELMMFL